MESANVPMGLAACRAYGIKFDVMSTSFFLSRRAVAAVAAIQNAALAGQTFHSPGQIVRRCEQVFSHPLGRAVGDRHPNHYLNRPCWAKECFLPMRRHDMVDAMIKAPDDPTFFQAVRGYHAGACRQDRIRNRRRRRYRLCARPGFAEAGMKVMLPISRPRR